jgi:hypothetical protein
MNRGMTRIEAEDYVKSKSEIRNYLMQNKDDAFILKAYCLLISYGVKGA